jgi:hypothetical protein
MSDKSPLERQLGRPLARPALPEGAPDFDDEPLKRAPHKIHTPEHWPDEEAAPPTGNFEVVDGELIRRFEYYFPLIWAVCVITISYIGIYHAVDKITTSNPLPPAWF